MRGDDSTAPDEDIVEPLICDYYGEYITEVNQKCPALDDGKCRP